MHTHPPAMVNQNRIIGLQFGSEFEALLGRELQGSLLVPRLACTTYHQQSVVVVVVVVVVVGLARFIFKLEVKNSEQTLTPAGENMH